MSNKSGGDIPGGLLIPDARIIPGNLTAQGAGATDSSYSQAGPRVGVPTPAADTDMILQSSGSQTASGETTIRIIEGGMPGEATFGTYASAGGETSANTKGWNGYNVITGYQAPRSTTTPGTSTPHMTCLRLPSGVIVAIGDQYGGAGAFTVYRKAPSASSASSSSLTLSDVQVDTGPAACVMPDGSVLLVLTAVYATNQPAQVHTFRVTGLGGGSPVATLVGRHVLRPGITAVGAVTITQKSMAYSNGQILLAVAYEDGADRTMATFASSDGGMTFVEVEDDWEGAYTEHAMRPRVVALPGGGFLLAYWRDLGALGAGGGAPGYVSRRVATAGSVPGDAVAISANAPFYNEIPSLAVWADEDGILYCIYRRWSTDQHSTCIKRSTDGGVTWAPSGELNRIFIAEGVGGAADGDLYRFDAVSLAGEGALVTRWAAATGTYDPSSIAWITLGGHASHTAPLRDYGSGTTAFDDFPQVSFAQGPEDRRAECYLPIDEPHNLGWTAAGTGADADDSIAAGILAYDTTAGSTSRYHYREFQDATITKAWALLDLSIEDNMGSVASQAVVVDLAISDATGGAPYVAGTFTTHVQLRIQRSAGTLSYRLYDQIGAAALGADQTVNTVTGKARLAIAIDSTGAALTWYSSDGDAFQAWRSGPGGTADNTAQAQGNLTRFGVVTPSATQFSVRMVGSSFYPDFWRRGGSTFAASWTNPTDILGRRVSAYPLTVDDGIRVRATDGPGRIGDAWTVATRYDYGVDNLHPTVAPHPSRVWRSTSVGAGVTVPEQKIAWSLFGGVATLPTGSLYALLLEGINWRTGYLGGYASAMWAETTIDAATDHASLSFTRAGDVVTITSATGRYIWPGEFVGGTVDFTASGDHRKIVECSGGASSSSSRPLVLRLDGIDGTEPASGTSDLDIWAPRVLVVMHATTAQSHLRLRIATTPTADNYLQIGTLLMGHVAAFGNPPSLGSGRTVAPRVTLEESPSGYSRPRVRGPAAREYTLQWSEWMYGGRIRGASPAPDYLRAHASLGNAVADVGATAELLEGLAEQHDGAATPMGLIRRIPHGQTTYTTTDRNEFALVRMTGATSSEHAVGRLGSTESRRLSALTFQEIR